FTLIELLIVIAIILILIAIALPNFLEAQQRAKIANVRAGMRGVGTAIEAFRTERGVLLIDFWEDGGGVSSPASQRWREKFGRVGRDPAFQYKTFEECYFPLTSPAAYLTTLPIDPFNDPSRSVGFGENEKGLAYIYFDNDVLDPNPANHDHGVEYYAPGGPGQVLYGAVPLKSEEFALLSVGPDRFIERTNGYSTIRGIPYNPTNGTNSIGDMVFRSSGIPG
ncbi:MAG: prepilin-type N-terminal cleavage/methylation domain-containing protein, partial [Candidatus Omnitrophica bacterium]|nr:prepilin-type N-terminal cleavage/methylation domain-containing protein [Candidatus Omnitrophota bacterium]